MYRIARRKPPTARSWLRSPSTAVALRSASPRTVSASEMAMVARAAESQSTARSAVPRRLAVSPRRRVGLLVVHIGEVRQAVDGDGRGDSQRSQPGGIVFQRDHFHAQALGPAGQDPIRTPLIDIGGLAGLQIRKAAPSQLVG